MFGAYASPRVSVARVLCGAAFPTLPLYHCCRRNAAIYGVANRVEFILGDAMKVLPTLKADAVFLSPPWGGPEYQASETFDLYSMIPPPLSALDVFRAARAVTPNVVFFLPRNVDPSQVAGLPAAAASLEADMAGGDKGKVGAGQGVDADEKCELEKQFLNGKLKTTAAYFGEDIVAEGEAKDADAEETPQQEVHGALADASESREGYWLEEETELQIAPAWSGRHVRFSDDDTRSSGAVLWQESGAGTSGSGGNGQQRLCSTPQKRENALYEAWMAAASPR